MHLTIIVRKDLHNHSLNGVVPNGTPYGHHGEMISTMVLLVWVLLGHMAGLLYKRRGCQAIDGRLLMLTIIGWNVLLMKLRDLVDAVIKLTSMTKGIPVLVL
jgi:hypothetical protein